MYSSIAGIMATSLWAGVVLGVSFVAQPAKFATPGLTRPIALAAGRQMFRAIHVVESALAISAIALLVWAASNLRWPTFAASAILAIQMLVLMPPLSERVDARLAGITPPKSPWHALFAASEVLKLLLLLAATALPMVHSSVGAP